MTSRGAVPGSTVVKQEENISREVSQGPCKREEQHTGPLFPSMQRRSEKEGVPPPSPLPPARVIRWVTEQDVLCYDSHQASHSWVDHVLQIVVKTNPNRINWCDCWAQIFLLLWLPVKFFPVYYDIYSSQRNSKVGCQLELLNVAIYVFKQRDFTFDLLWSIALEPNCFNLWVWLIKASIKNVYILTWHNWKVNMTWSWHELLHSAISEASTNYQLFLILPTGKQYRQSNKGLTTLCITNSVSHP